MEPLPDWISEGAIVHAQGGGDKVRPVLDALVKANVSLAALWIEDWCGGFHDPLTGSVQVTYNWVLDRVHYPNWDELVDTAHGKGARVMVYMNPFLIYTPTKAEGGNATRNLFDEAYTNGYLVGYTNGTYGEPGYYYGPYYSILISRVGAMLDVSNPAAVEWYKQVIQTEALGNARASGYMGDFGEWLPYRHTEPNEQGEHLSDVILHNKRDPLTYHNEYTDNWNALHKEAVDDWKKTNPNASTAINADPVVMVRTGYVQSPGRTQLYWLGDQTVLWDDRDGVSSAVTGILSGGMSGMSINHGDIGGYAGNGFAPLSFLKLCRTKNILMRWVELAAFSPVFRTHLGNAPDTNVQIDSDEDTIAHFARFSRLFSYMAEYRKGLMLEASTMGWPVVRPLFFHYPSDPTTHSLNTQFLLGEHLLVAPVLDNGIWAKRTIPKVGKVVYLYHKSKVYLPKGNWTRLWYETEGTVVSTGETFKIEVRYGKPAVYYTAGWDVGANLSSFVNGELEKEFPAVDMKDARLNSCRYKDGDDLHTAHS